MLGRIHLTPLDTVVPRSSIVRDAILVMGGSLTVAISAQIAVRLPFSPVPISAQTFAVLLVGACLGSKRGMLSILAYLAAGAMGLPVFAGGASGAAWLVGPTGGYLVGFAAAAWTTGWLHERLGDRSISGMLVVLLPGSAMIYLLGLPWLAHFVGTDSALALGLIPFLPGDLIKIALAASALAMGWRLGSLRGARAECDAEKLLFSREDWSGTP